MRPESAVTVPCKMELPDLFSHLNSISSSYQTHWNFYSAVVLGLLAAITMSKKENKIDVYVGGLLIVGLVLFFISNYQSIDNTSNEITIVINEIKRVIVYSNLGVEFKRYYCENMNLRVNHNWKIFHFIIDLFLVGATAYRVYGKQ